MGYEVVATWRQVVHWGPLLALSVTFIITTVTLKCLTVWWPPLNNAAGFTNMIVFLSWVVLILVNFFKAMFKGPGFIPFGWKPDDPENGKYMQFCESCKGYKPPRSHHCRKCDRCVMKMDHHCPWINTCCGHWNHANFCCFLFFAPCGCAHALCCLLPSIYRAVYFDSSADNSPAEQLVYMEKPMFTLAMFSTGLAIGVIISVGMLFIMQMKIVLKNETGIESWIIDKALDRERGEQEGPFIYPYNLGRYRNFLQVFNWSGRPRSDGYTWDIVDGCNQFTLTEEQLKQKADKRDRTVLYIVTERYSGCLFPCSKGLKVVCCVPCTDEARIRLEPGDEVMVTRWKKRWLYGTKLSSVENGKGKDRVRGWFPRVCAKEQPADGDKDQNKKDA